MANSSWHRGKAKGRAQAKAWLRHNDKERRADPQVRHANRDIDQSRTARNFEVGPTKGLSYDEKCARLDAALDRWGYPTDAEIGTVNSRTPSCMQGIIMYAPDDLDNDEAEADGRLEEWAEKAVGEACKRIGEENVIAAYVDVDEVHDYTDARTGERRTSKRHIHLYVVPVCEVKQTSRAPIYLRPDGTETLDADEAEQVYITPSNAETDDPNEAAKDDDGAPVMGPKCARLKSGRRKYKRQKRGEAETSKMMLRGSEFSSTENITAFNKAVHEMTVGEFGIKWNRHAPGTYQRNEDDEDLSTEELKARTAERETAAAVEAANAEISSNVERSEALLDEAENDRLRAQRERDGFVTYIRHGERLSAPIPPPRDGEDLCEYATMIEETAFPEGADLTDEGLGVILFVQQSPRVTAARAERTAQAIREEAEAKAARTRDEAVYDVQAAFDDALAAAHIAREEMRESDDADAARERHELVKMRDKADEREASLDERAAELDAGFAALEKLRAKAEGALRRTLAFADKLANAALALCNFADDVASGYESEGLIARGWRKLTGWFSKASDFEPGDDLNPNALSAEAFAEAFEEAKEETREDFRRKRATMKAARRSAQTTQRDVVHEVWDDEPKTSQRGYDGPGL